MMRRKGFDAAALASVVFFSATCAFAGPITPPPGPVSGTHKTLTEVEPRVAIDATNTPGDGDSVFRISQPGSYYLAGNITGVIGKHGIEIAANGVTIDLNGFSVIGVTGSRSGVFASAAVGNVSISDGTITGWGESGINLTSATFSSRVQNVHATSNQLTGVIAGPNAILTDCTSATNGLHGFEFAANGVAMNCVARQNGAEGFNTGVACVYIGCSARANGGDGIEVGESGVAQACASVSNNGSGFEVFSGAAVIECASRASGLDGIRTSSDAFILNNVCQLNGTIDGAGIRVLGNDCRIEGNHVLDNDRGIDVDSAGNLIIRNSASGNTVAFEIVAGNYGLFVAAVSGGAVNGSSGGAALGSTDPWANFSY